MSETTCEMCWKREHSTEVEKDGYTYKVCKDCREKWEQQKVFEAIQPLVEKLCHELNGGNMQRTVQAFFDAFTREHRYLQNQVFILLWQFFQKYGEQTESQYDARNAGAVKWAKKWYESA